MKTIQTTIAIFLLSIFTFSCSKEDGSNPADRIFRIQKIEQGTDIIKFTYNAENKIEVVVSNEKYSKFSYNAAGKILTEDLLGTANMNGKDTYTYDASGFKTEQMFVGNDGYKRKITFSNNNLGLPVTITYVVWNSPTNSWVTLIETETNMYNTNKQLIKKTTVTNYVEYSYDSKGNNNATKQYFKNSSGQYFLGSEANITYDDKKVIIDSPFVTDLHNIMDFNGKFYLPNGNIQSSNAGSRTYEYNQAGYVTKQFFNGTLFATYTLEQTN